MIDRFRQAAVRQKAKARFICKVCGDDATGYNFGGIVCESCKSFYRRHAHRRPWFRCLNKGTCQINKLTRRFCAACRLQKCFAVGMRVPIFSDSECQSEDSAWDNQRQTQRRVLMARLQQRIAAKNTTTSSDEASASSVTQSVAADASQIDAASELRVNDYDDLHERVAAAASSMQIRTNWPTSDEMVRNPGTQDASCIQLAFGNYIAGLRYFPEFLRLGETVHREILRNHMLEQINLYAIFAVNADVSGWCAVDARGAPCEHRFREFVACFSKDGVESQPYVTSFRDLVTSLRRRLECDWPFVLVLLCLMNLASDRQRPDLAGLEQLRRTYASFLQCYLEQQYPANHAELLHFCTEDFWRGLEKVVEIHERMLAQIATNRPAQSAAPRSMSPGANGESAASLHLAKLFEPIVSQVVRQLTFCS